MQSGIALAASPVSAAMAAMLTLTDVAPYNLGLSQILAITMPACVIGIFVTSLVVSRMWKDLDEDPEVQARIASGELAPPAGRPSEGESAASKLTFTKEGRNSALAFLLGVVLIVIFGLFPDLRPASRSRARTRADRHDDDHRPGHVLVGVAILFLGAPTSGRFPTSRCSRPA